MANFEVKVPRVNANEDEILITEIHCKIGDDVAVGDLLAEGETTKASVEIEAEVAGTISKINGKTGRMSAAGSSLIIIATEGGIDASEDATASRAGKSEVKITTKAKVLAEENGIDIALIAPKDGRIGVDQVTAAIKSGAGKSEASEAIPQITTLKAVIVGGGGHSATIAEVAIAAGWNLVGAVDGKLAKGETVISGVEVIDNDDALQDLFNAGVTTAFIGVGGATSSETRQKIFENLVEIGFSLPPLVHPTAHLGSDVALGPATYVLPQAMVGPRCRIGANVIVNASTVVAHDCQVEDHAHLTPAAILAGNVAIGAGSVIGMGASVLFGVSVGRNCLVHNNVSVLMDVPDNTEVSLESAPKRRTL